MKGCERKRESGKKRDGCESERECYGFLALWSV